MAYSTRTIGIIVASAIAVVLVVVAVLISGPLPFFIKAVDAASTHELLVQYASKDTDNDGLPDWEEALYGTDPNNPHSLDKTLSDGDAVAKGLAKPKIAAATTTPATDLTGAPGTDVAANTITDQYAQQLFGQYLSEHGGQTPTPDEIATYVEQSVSDLNSANVRPAAYNAGQVHVAGTGPDALLSYAADAENTFAKNAANTDKSEAEYMSDAVLKNDPTATKQMAKIGTAYTATAKALIAISAPREAAGPHLALANALSQLGADITDMAAINTDPLRGYIGLAKYENDAQGLVTAFASMDGVFKAEQVSVPEGTTGSSFWNVLERAASGPPKAP